MIKEGEATQAQVNAQLEALNNAYNSLEKYVPATGLKIGLDDDTSGATVVNDGFIRYTGSVVSGRAVQLNAELTPSNSQYTSIEWTSSNEDITVDDTGLVVNGKLTGAGVTKITCKITTAYGNEYEASAWVSFVRYGVTAVTFDSDVIYGAPQETKTITPNLNQSSQSSASCVNDCLYESSNTDVATVNDKGEVTFLTQGTAVITVTALDGGYVGTINATTTWDTTALQEAINQAKTYNYMDYAYDYGIAFNNAYTRAVEVYENPTASQVAINVACTNLVEAMTNLEGHEFITPVAEFYANGEELVAGKAYAVDSNNQVKINYTLNDGAMYKSVNITAVGTGITTSDTTNGIVLTKSITANTSVTVTAVVTDAYDRETTSTYIITVANKIINVTSVAITENDVEVGDTLVKTGFSLGYTDFSGIQLGYTLNPSSATTPAKVEWSSSAENRIVVDETGLVTLTTIGKGFSSNTADITCTVTNSDGTTVSKTVTVTIARK
jgi:hypothetical protein